MRPPLDQTVRRERQDLPADGGALDVERLGELGLGAAFDPFQTGQEPEVGLGQMAAEALLMKAVSGETVDFSQQKRKLVGQGLAGGVPADRPASSSARASDANSGRT